MQNEFIVVREYCDKCHIEQSFIEMLNDNGLIEIVLKNDEPCLPFVQLPDIERYSRMYYDLSINMEGIDTIHNLLMRIESMQDEIRHLRSRLRLYEDDY